MAVLHEVLDQGLRELDRAVGCDEGCLMAYDPDVLLPVAFSIAGDLDSVYADGACRNEYLEPDLHKFAELASGDHHVAVLSRADPAARRSRRWQALIEPRGHRHELRATLLDPSGRCWAAVSMLRHGTSEFDEAAVRTIDRLAGPIAARLARAMVVGAEAHERPAVCSLLLDPTGELLHATPAAQRWLADSQESIPLVGGLGVARAVAYRVVAGAAEAGPVSVRMRVGDGWIAMHGERVTGRDGEPRGVSLVIEPAHPGTILPLAVAAYGFTPREAEVTREVLKGLDTKTISRVLRISEYTVQDHLKSAFGKAGVRSRGELAHALAVGLVWPAAHDGAAPPKSTSKALKGRSSTTSNSMS